MKRGAGSITIVAALLLAGCVPEQPRDVTYDNILELRDAVETSGHNCDAFEIRDEGAEGATETAYCTSNSVLAMFENTTDARTAADGVNEIVVNMLGIASTVLVGPNWSVNCDGENTTCKRIQRSIGGELVTLEP